MGRGLFWEKLGDLRFRRIEKQIFEAYFVEGLRSMSEIACKIGVSRSTILRHHAKISEIKDDYIDYLVLMFEKEVCAKNVVWDFRKTVFNLLIFMVRYKGYFEEIFCGGAEKLVLGLLKKMQVLIGGEFGYLKDDFLFRIFSYEVYVVLENWAKRGFLGEEINLVTNRIMLLARTSGERLKNLK